MCELFLLFVFFCSLLLDSTAREKNTIFLIRIQHVLKCVVDLELLWVQFKQQKHLETAVYACVSTSTSTFTHSFWQLRCYCRWFAVFLNKFLVFLSSFYSLAKWDWIIVFFADMSRFNNSQQICSCRLIRVAHAHVFKSSPQTMRISAENLQITNDISIKTKHFERHFDYLLHSLLSMLSLSLFWN